MGQALARWHLITVDPPYRVVFSWGIPGSGTLPPGGSTVEVVLTPDGDGTMVVLTHRGLPSAHIGGHRACWAALGHLPAAAGYPWTWGAGISQDDPGPGSPDWVAGR